MRSEEKVATSPGTLVHYVVARVEDVPEGQRLTAEVGGRLIAIFNVGGTFHALLHECPHARGPLCDGPLQRRLWADRPGEQIKADPRRVFISCPWHGWMFDLESGESWWDPQRTRARRFSVEVASGDDIAQRRERAATPNAVRGPYVAQTFPVEVDGDYIVVAMRPRPRRVGADEAV